MNYWAYIMFSAVDLICTIRLYCIGGLDELNPLADWVFAKMGAVGLAGYKVVLITAICMICLYISRTHPKSSSRILILANGLGLMVTLYQIGLMVGV